MSSEQDRRRHAEFLAVGFLTTDQLNAGIVKATFTSHDRLADAARAAAVELRDIGSVPPIRESLLEIAHNLESALKEAHDDTA